MDIVLGDPTFEFPLDKANYTDRDMIIWGGKKQILAGDAEYGARLLLAELLRPGHDWGLCTTFWACAGATSSTPCKQQAVHNGMIACWEQM